MLFDDTIKTMDTIELREAALVQEVQEVAAQEGRDAEDFVTEAVRVHLAQYRQKRILAETEAWYQLSVETRTSYHGQYVALANGQIVDSDQDQSRLYFRVRERYGHQPVLIVEGGNQPMPTYRVRSPRRV